MADFPDGVLIRKKGSMVWKMYIQKYIEERPLRNNRKLVKLLHKQGAHTISSGLCRRPK